MSIAGNKKSNLEGTNKMVETRPRYRQFMTWVAGNDRALVGAGILSLKMVCDILNAEYEGYDVIHITHLGTSPENQSQGFLYFLQLRDA